MAKKGAGSGDELYDALYAASPKQFVAERARVLAALKAAGRGDEARAVGKMKRPSASVWAVNQLARRAGDEIAELLELGGSLRAGERAMLRGGDAAGFMEEARTARQKVAALARQAEAIVEESGQKATLALGRQIAQTLQAAITGDDDTRAQLEAGRLEHDLAPRSEFGAAGDLSAALAASVVGKAAHGKAAHGNAAHGKPSPAATHHAADRKPAAHERKRAADERKRAAANLRAQRRAQAAARKHAASLARAATAADRVVTERARAVERQRAAVERAERELREAKDALAEAELAAAAAHRAVEDAAP
ncbi:MAG TPA: hypothetical protein VN947_30260 [Polyangia bacterium]|nr:hypothetical protein [Polyangia bacterium]